KWYEEQKIEAEELGLELDTLNASYAVQREEVEATRREVEEDIVRRLGVLREAAIPGAGLSQAELAIFDLTTEFVNVIEEIHGWAKETNKNYDALILNATELYELEMEAALAQSEAAQEIQDSISEWTNVIASIDDTLYGLQTTIVSPAAVTERMSIIESIIKGFGEVATPEQATELQQLWMDYLDLAQEAYQRPSSEYQAIYDETISALEDIQTDAEAFVTSYKVQLDTLDALIFGGKSAAEHLSEIVTAIQEGIPVDVALTTEDFVVTIPDVAVDVTILDIIIPAITIP
ncbi:unnamed protein product, partial [marine sediment metagenome]